MDILAIIIAILAFAILVGIIKVLLDSLGL